MEVREKCPDCGRPKAHYHRELSEMIFCPKWFAIRDPEAEEDCRKFKERMETRARFASQTTKELLEAAKKLSRILKEKENKK